MLPLVKSINLIRYLIVWRINSNLVWHPNCLPTLASYYLGNTIADNLSTRQARPWRKALLPWAEHLGLNQKKKNTNPPRNQRKTVPDTTWPIESSLFFYPSKTTYGLGEPILWELKLFGASADHNLFLEFILPAMEVLSTKPEKKSGFRYNLWGHFDIEAVYVARGQHWEPIIEGGHLNLKVRPTPIQWAEGLSFKQKTPHRFSQINWITPFDLRDVLKKKTLEKRSNQRQRHKQTRRSHIPMLQDLMDALIIRISQLLPNKQASPDDVWSMLNKKERTAIQNDMRQATNIPLHHHEIETAPKSWPANWIGQQVFPSIPLPIMPYLELASILHLGKYTHFGCGTFVVSD